MAECALLAVVQRVRYGWRDERTRLVTVRAQGIPPCGVPKFRRRRFGARMTTAT